MTIKIILCHSGRQHSHQLAEALYRKGMLSAYWTGVPTHFGMIKWLPVRVQRKYFLDKSFQLTRELVRCYPLVPIIARIGNVFLLVFQRICLQSLAESFFDYYVSRLIASKRFDLLIGYENTSLNIFKEAKKKNAKIILDAASFHFEFQDQNYDYLETDACHKRIITRKKEEIQLADFIVTCSEFARQSYLLAGVRESKVISIPLGVDVSKFRTRTQPRNESLFTFLFVGALSTLKGIDLLLQAFEEVLKQYPLARLKLVGRSGNAKELIKKFPFQKQLIVKGPLAHEQLVREYQDADCFILPSRFDSFGMVVLESLACGVPAIVSNSVGAKELIQDSVNGWVLEANSSEAIKNKMLWCLRNQNEVSGMAKACRCSAEKNSWQLYQERISLLIERLINNETD